MHDSQQISRGEGAASAAVERVQTALEQASVALTIARLWLASAGLADAFRRIRAGPAPQRLLGKWGEAWRNEPRVPAGNPDGGQWTSADDVAPSPAAREAGGRPDLPIGDGAYRPATDKPQITLTGGSSEEESRPESQPPPEVRTLESIFPGLRTNPTAEILLAPLDAFVGFSEAADAANLEATMGQYNALVEAIKRLDPNFVDEELLPQGGIAGLSWEGRTNLIDGMRMKLAAVYYLKTGDIGPLQGETLMFLRNAVDKAYDQAVNEANADRLKPRLSREEAIGNWVDSAVRRWLKNLFSSSGIDFGPKQNITVNNRDYETSDDGLLYRVPDARVGDIVYDWTLEPKTLSYAQIRAYFRADSQPNAVVIIRPSQLGPDGTYLIRRPKDKSRPGR